VRSGERINVEGRHVLGLNPQQVMQQQEANNRPGSVGCATVAHPVPVGHQSTRPIAAWAIGSGVTSNTLSSMALVCPHQQDVGLGLELFMQGRIRAAVEPGQTGQWPVVVLHGSSWGRGRSCSPNPQHPGGMTDPHRIWAIIQSGCD